MKLKTAANLQSWRRFCFIGFDRKDAKKLHAARGATKTE
jgi:hypothetical protein